MSSDASASVDARWMALALSIGRRAMGRVWPNPAVGCVLVKDGRVIGRGWTQDDGRPHAEVIALTQAGSSARAATAYVTLEPCAHTGKTPPCCDALINAGVRRVVIAIGDPDPRVAGKGIARLKAAGISVSTGVLEAAARSDHSGFLGRITERRPMVTLKLATSLDGRIATETGESQWITGPEARRVVHAMRSRHDAVMIGAGTARDDLPSLTVRGLGVDRQPVRVVLSSRLDLPKSGPLFETAKDVPVWIIHGPEAAARDVDAWGGAGARLIALGTANLSVVDALAALAAEGITRVFCEGGGGLAASLLQAECVDELLLFSAGKFIGAEGRPGLGGLGLAKLGDAPRFALKSVKNVGEDVLQHWVSTVSPSP